MCSFLNVNGYQPQSAVQLDSIGTLGGSGTVGNITNSGNLMPGSSPGCLTCSNLVFTSSGDYYPELKGATPCAGYDQIKVRGVVTLANAILHPSLGFDSPISSSFTIIDNDGADIVSGTILRPESGCDGKCERHPIHHQLYRRHGQ